MRKLSLCLILVIICLGPCLAQDWVEKGDRLARWGALKDADEAYRTAESSLMTGKFTDLQKVCFRRLSLAQVVGDEREARRIISKLSDWPSDSETKIRVSSARAALAYSAGRSKTADQEFTKVLSLTSGRTEPYAVVARFAAESFKYKQAVDAQGWPSPDEVAKEVTRVLSPLGSLPKGQLYEPLLLTKAHPWVELWIKDTLKRIEANPQTSKKELGNLSFVVGMVQLSLGDRFGKLKDPEAGGLAIQYPLDMADGLAEFNPAEALRWIRQVEFFLEIGRAKLKRANLGADISGTGLNYFEARLAAVRGKVRIQQGQIGPGLTDLKAAASKLRAAAIHRALLTALVNYATALHKHGGPARFQEAKKVVAEAQELNRTLNLRRTEIQLLLLESKLQARGSAAESAIMWKAVELLEAESPYLSKSAENSKLVSDTYDPLITFLAKQGQAEKALDLEVRRTALRQASEKDLGEIQTNDPELQAALLKAADAQNKARELQSQLQAAELLDQPGERAKLEREIAENRGDFLKTLNSISRTNPEYANLVAIRPTNFARLQSHLPPGALLLQYCQTDTQMLIFTASSTKLSIKTVPLTRKELKKAVLKARRKLSKATGKLEPLRKLYSILIAPVQEEVDKASVLVIAPTEGLYFVPFAALNSKVEGRDTYLIEQKALVNVNSPEMLMSQGSQKRELQGIVVLGDPDGTLPAAKKEAAEVGQLFNQSKVYLAKDATSAPIKRLAGNTSFVHLATHAITNPQDVNSSYLVVANDGKSDRLTLGEIYGLNFDGVSLVTLSACGTATGQDNPTWSVASLAQAFHLAGAGTLVASLWDVDDGSTRDLMLGFYRNLKQGKSKAEAMRLAQIQLIKSSKYSDPYYWSGFTVIGDWR